MRSEYFVRLVAALVAASVVACGGAEGDEEVFDDAADDMDAFAATGKTDTGYVSDKAAELNAELSGKIVLDVASLPAGEREPLVAKARAGDKAAFALLPTEQVKYARNVLKKEKFNANIESGAANVTSVALTGNGARIEVVYKLTVESLVKDKDLQAQGLTLTQLIGRTVALTLPADPKSAFAKGGLACAEDPDDPSENISTEISVHNYFYYWKPEKSGCSIPKQDVTFTVKNPSAAKPSYPEFDKLLADKKITMVVLFGQLEHGDLLSGTGADEGWDWGWIGYDDFSGWLRKEGYKEVVRVPAGATLAATKSSKWTKKYSANMTVEVDLTSPLELQDHADQARKDEIFRTAMKTHEIVYYNGHSFYGSLNVLNDRANFPSYYQIVFMDSCWSYAYYTKQVFTAKTTSADPTGMVNADVINNTEPGISGSHETYGIYLKKLFTAANFVAQGQKSKAKSYTWKNLMSYMNTSAKKRAEDSARRGDPHDPEIYGVSGVSANAWKP